MGLHEHVAKIWSRSARRTSACGDSSRLLENNDIRGRTEIGRRRSAKVMFSKLKALLRRAAERTIEGLWCAIADCIPLVTSRECANYFEAAGYEPT